MFPAIGCMAAVADADGARTLVAECAFCRTSLHREGLPCQPVARIGVDPAFAHCPVGGIYGGLCQACAKIAALHPFGASVGQEAFDTLQQRVLPLESVFLPIGRVGRVLCDGHVRHAPRRYMPVVLLLPARHKGQYRGKDNNCGSNFCSHDG